MTDKEEQIDEIARVICDGCHDTEECKRAMCLEYYYAKKIYEAGYRKQVDGEWEERIFIIFDTEKVGYHCPKCDTTWDTKTNYCPNCGAKMKGGAHE